MLVMLLFWLRPPFRYSSRLYPRIQDLGSPSDGVPQSLPPRGWQHVLMFSHQYSLACHRSPSLGGRSWPLMHITKPDGGRTMVHGKLLVSPVTQQNLPVNARIRAACSTHCYAKRSHLHSASFSFISCTRCSATAHASSLLLEASPAALAAAYACVDASLEASRSLPAAAHLRVALERSRCATSATVSAAAMSPLTAALPLTSSVLP